MSETSTILRNSTVRSADTDTSTTTATPKTTTSSPSEAALASLKASAASLATSTHQQFVLEYGSKLINFAAKVSRQEKILKAFDDPTHIARSARIAFKLNASTTVAETPEFATATVATNALVERFQLDLTTQIRTVATLELTQHRQNCARHLIKSVFSWAKISAILAASNDAANDIVYYPFVVAAVNKQPIRDIISTLLPDDRSGLAMIISFTGPIVTGVVLHENDQTREFAEIVNSVFGNCITTFSRVEKENNGIEAVRQFLQASTILDATAAAAMIVDAEPSVDPVILQSMIQKAVKKELKSTNKATTNSGSSDNKQINNSTEKNGRRGATGASEKKKSGKTDGSTTTNNNKKASNTTSQRNKSKNNTAANTPAASATDLTPATKRGQSNNSRRPLRKKQRNTTAEKKTQRKN
jgi:hypothetical protein